MARGRPGGKTPRRIRVRGRTEGGTASLGPRPGDIRSTSALPIFVTRTMASEQAASAMGVVTALGSASTNWPDELWAGSVSLFDSIIRTCYGVYEFTDDPACVLRVGLSQARASLTLSDGTRVEYGELIGTLHWWNEHLPRYSTERAGFRLGLRDARPCAAFASFARCLCRERERLARDTRASGRCRAVGPARHMASTTCRRALRI